MNFGKVIASYILQNLSLSLKIFLYAMDTNKCYTFRFSKAIWHSSTPATSIPANYYLIVFKSWINSWLTQRKQRVIADGSTSIWTPVKSGVPQGTVLGPLMFLIYINDIGDKVSSSLQLFADDCVLYRTVTSLEDSKQLQFDHMVT